LGQSQDVATLFTRNLIVGQGGNRGLHGRTGRRRDINSRSNLFGRPIRLGSHVAHALPDCDAPDERGSNSGREASVDALEGLLREIDKSAHWIASLRLGRESWENGREGIPNSAICGKAGLTIR
jgi:hypothetical protein